MNHSDNCPTLPLSPCLRAVDIIRQCAVNLMQPLKNLISAPNYLYNQLYLATVHSLAEYCQNMPAQQEDKPFSLFQQQLQCCIAALQLRRAKLLPKHASTEAIAEQEPQWTYAIFSASLLHRLYEIQQNCQVKIYNAERKFIRLWNAKESLYHDKHYFSIDWQLSSGIASTTALMSTLITQLIPPVAISWLNKNIDLAKQWYSAITDTSTTNSITEIVLRAADVSHHKIKQRQDIKENLIQTHSENISSQVKFNDNEQIDSIEIQKVQNQPDESQLNCLLDYVQSQQASERNAVVWLRVEPGLFITTATLEAFIKARSIWENSQIYIETIKPYLVCENNEYYFRYRPKAFEDRRIFKGIIVKKEVLNSVWNIKSITDQFQRAITL